MNPRNNFYNNDYLETPSEQAVGILREKNKLDTTEIQDPSTSHVNWNSTLDKQYGNFMKLTSAPQRNPYGITGNKQAMQSYELQGPLRSPTLNNPFMNTPIIDYGTSQKYSSSEKTCGSQCQTSFYKNMIRSPDDSLWERQASERQFYTVPNTSVPNEQVKFAEWLYGNNQVGKSGSIYDRYGYPYTPDSLVNTGANAASPQNAGQTENNYGTPNSGGSPWVNNPNYGYGFGGLPGGVPYSGDNITRRTVPYASPQPLAPHFPKGF